MQKKKGISLIVLVITIIVMIILAATVVVSLSNTGVIDKATHAVKLTDEKQVQDLAALLWAEAYLDENRTESIETIVIEGLENGGVTIEEWNITISDTGVVVKAKESDNNDDENVSDGFVLSGSWIMNEQPTLPNASIEQLIEFTSTETVESNIVYTLFRVVLDPTYMSPGIDLYMSIHYEHDKSVSSKVYNNENAAYTSEDYRYIDFGTESQVVSEEFYNWFIANATQR